MPRFRTVFGTIRRASAEPARETAPGLLSPRGRWVAVGQATPGVAAIVTAPFLMTSAAATAWTSAGTLLLAGGALTVLAAYPVALLRACWSRWMRGGPAGRRWPVPSTGSGLATALALAAANVAGAAVCAVAAAHHPPVAVTAVCLAAVAVLHLGLPRDRRLAR